MASPARPGRYPLSRRDLLATLAGTAGGVALWGCGGAARPATANGSAAPATDVPSAGKFPHGLLSLVLSKVVTPAGLVDYAALEKDVASLDAYLAELARISPPAQKHLFPTEPDAMAYWVNAHNACALKAVLQLGKPADLRAAGSRVDHSSFVFGGKSLTILGTLGAVRRYADPRVHFVLSRGRRGGPPLRSAAYEPATLDDDLGAAARAFVMDPANVAWEPPSLEAGLSRVFLDYRDDFERQAPATVTGDARLVQAVNLWRARGREIVASTVKALPLDERLNAA